VLILRHEEEELLPGGGANAVANVAALDGRPLPVGVAQHVFVSSGDTVRAPLEAAALS
jgi:bifunctional ADP-heptose synthase (sugar kinase/adenylyltransferase)